MEVTKWQAHVQNVIHMSYSPDVTMSSEPTAKTVIIEELKSNTN